MQRETVLEKWAGIIDVAVRETVREVFGEDHVEQVAERDYSEWAKMLWEDVG